LTSCTKATYVAHVAKQIPLPTDTPRTVGYYKVGSSYTIKNKRYYPAETFSHTETGSVILRVNDRGPFAHNRVLDVSERAASLLGFKNDGVANVRIQVLPEESKYVANAAKQGIDTTGYEVALNQNKVPQLNTTTNAHKPYTSTAKPTNKPEPITQVTLSNSSNTAPVPKPAPVERQNLIVSRTASLHQKSIEHKSITARSSVCDWGHLKIEPQPMQQSKD